MSEAAVADTLSDALLRDFRVGDAAVALVDIGEAALRVSRTTLPMLHLVLAGTVIVECADHPPERLGEGEAILLFYGDRHRITSPGARGGRETTLPGLPRGVIGRIDAARGRPRATILSFQIELSYVAPAAAAIRAGPPVVAMRRHPAAGDAGTLGFDAGEIAEACNGPGALAFCMTLAGLFVVHGMRTMYHAQWNDASLEVRSPATRRVAAAMQAVQAHPERPWTVASLAQTVGISRSSFASAFREVVGVTPVAYVRDVRLERARQLLGGGALSVTEVARRSGYPLPSSFARAFARRYGGPPSLGYGPPSGGDHDHPNR